MREMISRPSESMVSASTKAMMSVGPVTACAIFTPGVSLTWVKTSPAWPGMVRTSTYACTATVSTSSSLLLLGVLRSKRRPVVYPVSGAFLL